MPQPNNSKTVSLLVVALIVALGVIVALLFPRVTEEANSPISHVSTTVPVAHQYKNGIHTYVGEVESPTPCYVVTGEAIVRESYPEQVDIRIETQNSGEICTQVITLKKFRVSFHASDKAVIRAFLNGVPVLFKVEEAPASLNLESVTL